jgi:hypothetical protein
MHQDGSSIGVQPSLSNHQSSLTTYPILDNVHKLTLSLVIDNFLLGTFTTGVHKRNFSPQNHFQDTSFNDHYTYKIIYLVDYFYSLDIHIFLD